MRKVPKPVAIGASLTVVLMGAGLIYWLGRTPSLMEVANRLDGCVVKQDYDCLYDSADSDEIKAYGLSRESFRTLMREYVYQGKVWEKSKPSLIRSLDGNDRMVDGAAFLKNGDNRRAIGFAVAATDAGPKAIGFVTSALMSRAPNDGDSVLNLLRWVERDRAELERLGIAKIYRGFNEPMMTWDEYIDSRRKLYGQRIAMKHAPPDPTSGSR